MEMKAATALALMVLILAAGSCRKERGVSRPQPAASPAREGLDAASGGEEATEAPADPAEDGSGSDAPSQHEEPGEVAAAQDAGTAAGKEDKPEFKIFHDEKKFKKLEKVKKGWTEQKVLKIAGEPSSRKGEVWYYYWQEPGMECVRYKYYNFTFKDGKVVDIDSGAGHEHMEIDPF